MCGGVVVVMGGYVTRWSGEAAALAPCWRTSSVTGRSEAPLLVVMRVGVRLSPTLGS